MRRYVPNRVEFSVLAVLALLCALVATSTAQPDLVLAGLAFPVCLTAGFMGMRRRFGALARKPGDDRE